MSSPRSSGKAFFRLISVESMTLSRKVSRGTILCYTRQCAGHNRNITGKKNLVWRLIPKDAKQKKERKLGATSFRFNEAEGEYIDKSRKRKIQYWWQRGRLRFFRSSRHLYRHCLLGVVRFQQKDFMPAATRHLFFFTTWTWIFPRIEQVNRRQLPHAIVGMNRNPASNCQVVNREYEGKKTAHGIKILGTKLGCQGNYDIDIYFCFDWLLSPCRKV